MKKLLLVLLLFAGCYTDNVTPHAPFIRYEVVTDATSFEVSYISNREGDHATKTISQNSFEHGFNFVSNSIDTYIEASTTTGTFIEVRVYINFSLVYSDTGINNALILERYTL